MKSYFDTPVFDFTSEDSAKNPALKGGPPREGVIAPFPRPTLPLASAERLREGLAMPRSAERPHSRRHAARASARPG